MNGRTILVVKQRIPYPMQIGSDAVSFALLRALQQRFQITLLSVDDGERAQQGTEQLRDMGFEVILVPRDERLATKQTAAGSIVRNARLLFAGTPRNLLSQSCRYFEPALDELTRERQFGLTQFENWATARYRRFVHGPTALLNHDAWFRTVEAFARFETSPVNKFFWWLEARAVRRYEIHAQDDFDWRLFLSAEDRQDILGDGSAARSAVLPVPFPFEPEDPALVESQRTSPRIIFVGAMNVQFNIDAACYFVASIWPAVRRAVPEAQFTIAGRLPAERVLRLAKEPGVLVDSDPDLDALLRTSQVAVSPSRIGTGIKVKVAQAMAHGLPVVGTSAGLSGLRDAACLRWAGTEQSFAEQVVQLLMDGAQRRQAGRECHAYYRDHLWMESAGPRVLALYGRMIEELVGPAAEPAAAPPAMSDAR